MNFIIKLGFFLEIIVIGMASTLIVKDGLPRLFDTVVQVVVPPVPTVNVNPESIVVHSLGLAQSV